MKFKALWKDTFREINKSKMRFLAILTIILLGVAFYVGISATGPDMVNSSEQYYEDLNLMDYKVQSNYGLTEKDIDSLEEIDDISVQSHYAYDFLLEDASSIRLYSLDTEKGQDINQYYVVDGRLPNKKGEIALDNKKQSLGSTKIGDVIQLESGENAGEPEKNLNTKEFEVVGFVNSPLFIELESRGVASVGSGTLNSFGVIPEESYTSDIFTEAYLKVDSSEKYDAYSEEYEDYTDKYSSEIENKLTKLQKDRKKTIVNEAEEEIDDGKTEIKEAKEELNDAENELKEARSDIDDGWQELEHGKEELATERENAQNEINKNEQELQKGKAELETKKNELIQEKEALKNKKEELKENENELNNGISRVQNNLNEINKNIEKIQLSKNELESKKKTIQNAFNLPELNIQEITSIIKETENKITDFQNQEPINKEKIQKLEDKTENLNNLINIEKSLISFQKKNELENQLNQLNQKKNELNQGKNEIESGLSQIEEGLLQLNEKEDEIQEDFNELEEAKNTLSNEIATTEKELNNAEEELEEAEREYQNNLEEFEKEKADALEEIEEAEEEIEKSEEELDKLAAPDYQKFDRSDNIGYLEYKDNADRLSIIAKVFPVFFFLIAIFISFTTMTRMVDEEREYIGIMKAMGYKNKHILIKFIVYASIATIFGSILGLILGYTLFPSLIFYAYESMYNFPELHLQQYSVYTIIALVFAFVSTVGASLLAARYSLRSNAAQLLQPKPPKKGSRIWLEKLDFIWDRLSFNYKITFRNVFRYKSRMLMTILGIAGSTGLILTGFGISDSIGDILDIQYGDINQFEAYVAMDPNANETEIEDYQKESQNMDAIEDELFILQKNVRAKEEELSTQDITFFVPENPKELDNFVNLTSTTNDNKVDITNNSGVYLTDKIAKLLDLKIGDTFEVLNADDEVWEAEVAGIVENYVGHIAYMTPGYYSEVTGDSFDHPDVQLINYNKEEIDVDSLGSELIDDDAVAGIQYVDDIYNSFASSLESLDLITQILIISAAALAFIVLYNLTNINVSERRRELSTIKVLGSYDYEVTSYIYRENIILTILGIIVGLGFGKILTNFIMETMEIDMLVFGRNIYLPSYLYASSLTFLFTLVVMLVIHFQLKKIDMVEALKGND